MVGTRHAVSDNKSKADSACRVHTSPIGSRFETAREGEITAEQVATSAVHHTQSARRTGVCSPHKAQMDIQSIF